MPGYRKQGTIFNLTFEQYEGLEVNIRGLNTGQMMKLWDDSANARAAKNAGDKDEAAKSTKEMLVMFSDALIKWNLEDEDGEPFPPTYEGVLAQDLPFVLSLVEAWTDALAGVDANLGKDSDSGKQSPEVPIPMETL